MLTENARFVFADGSQTPRLKNCSKEELIEVIVAFERRVWAAEAKYKELKAELDILEKYGLIKRNTK